MMILSPAIMLKEAPQKRSRGLLLGALLVVAGLCITARAAQRDRWN
jgi:hypothetical protein